MHCLSCPLPCPSCFLPVLARLPGTTLKSGLAFSALLFQLRGYLRLCSEKSEFQIIFLKVRLTFKACRFLSVFAHRHRGGARLLNHQLGAWVPGRPTFSCLGYERAQLAISCVHQSLNKSCSGHSSPRASPGKVSYLGHHKSDIWVQILTLSLTSFMALSKLLNSFMSQFPIYKRVIIITSPC